MNIKVQSRALLLALPFATPSLLALAGCGGQADPTPVGDEATVESVSKYEAEIAKSKAAKPRKAAR